MKYGMSQLPNSLWVLFLPSSNKVTQFPPPPIPEVDGMSPKSLPHTSWAPGVLGPRLGGQDEHGCDWATANSF